MRGGHLRRQEVPAKVISQAKDWYFGKVVGGHIGRFDSRIFTLYTSPFWLQLHQNILRLH